MPWGEGTQTKAACRAARALLTFISSIQLRFPRPFRPHSGSACLPRASAFGLSPGLGLSRPVGPVLLDALLKQGEETCLQQVHRALAATRLSTWV